MNTSKETYVALFVGLVIVLAIAGGYYFPVAKTQVAFGSPVGTTFNTAKLAAINFSLASATSTSLLNGDASDRYVKSLEYACTGVGTSNTAYTGTGLASVTFQSSTSTTASGSSFVAANTNYVFNTTLATSSTFFIVASSTQAVGGLVKNQVWPAGTYLNMFTNATNTASCTGGVSYLAS